MIRRFENKLRFPSPCDLGSAGVLVTRPAAQAERLCRLIEANGGRAVRFPAISIEPCEDPGSAMHILAQPWDLMIFVSRNAVERSLPLLPNARLPARSELAAVGDATAQSLIRAGRKPDLVPAGRFDSESLLALPALADLRGMRVLIVRGSGGRRLLGDTLTERGAELAYAEVYRRTLPKNDPTPLLSRWSREVQLAIATSGEILHNLLTLIGPNGRGMLLATPLIVVSERTATAARSLGFVRVEQAERAADEDIVDALCRALAPPSNA